MIGRNTLAWTVAVAVSVAVGGFVGLGGWAVAAEKEAPTGRILVQTEKKDKKVEDRPVLVSILAGGKIVGQWEMKLGGSNVSYSLPAGTYDVRVEGEGCVTLVKRGIAVTGGDHPVLFPMSDGKGVRVVEYATGAMSREEIAEKLARLEAAVARLQAEAKDAKPASARDEK